MLITVADAQIYFDTYVLETEAWDISTSANRTIALNQSTLMIEALNFIYPLSSYTTIPTKIQYATADLALKLLDGIDPDFEFENFALTSQSFSNIRLSRESTSVPDYIMAGIPSKSAWDKLSIYLKDARVIKMVKT